MLAMATPVEIAGPAKVKNALISSNYSTVVRKGSASLTDVVVEGQIDLYVDNASDVVQNVGPGGSCASGLCFDTSNYASSVALYLGSSDVSTSHALVYNQKPLILSLNESRHLDPRPAPESSIRTNMTSKDFTGAFLNDNWLAPWTDLKLAFHKNATHSACGEISTPTIWSGEVRITCGVRVKSTLQIEPGTWVRSHGDEIVVDPEGTMYANGTTSPVTFTSAAAYDGQGSWSALKINR